MRLFTGTYVDRENFQYIYDDIKEDFKAASFGKWVEKENLHFTYHFIGDVPDDRVEELRSGLAGITVEYSSSLELRGIGVFPNLRRPRILHIPILSNNLLQKIYKDIGSVLDSLGFKTEEKKYKPHLTLQRIKDYDKEKFRDVLNKYKDYDFGEMNSFKVSLIQSKLTSRGPVYRVLQ